MLVMTLPLYSMVILGHIQHAHEEGLALAWPLLRLRGGPALRGGVAGT